MKTTGNTILITGGGTGIGLAMTEAFVGAGNNVIICGRREQKLQEAKELLPDIHIKQCDVSKSEERDALYNWIKDNFNNLNILINNAGIQRMINLTQGNAELLDGEDEIDINFKAPVQLSALFVPLLAERDEAAIINISSGLGFVPIAFMPVYCATKAALHSFTVSLRHQLRNSSIKVFEVIPPTVDTELDKGARDKRGQADHGIPPTDVAIALLQGMENDEFEICVGRAQGLKAGSRENFEEIFNNMNRY